MIREQKSKENVYGKYIQDITLQLKFIHFKPDFVLRT